MEWSEVLNQIIQAIVPVLLSLITYGSYLLKKKIDDSLDTKQKKDVANLVVRFVNQTLRDSSNEEKKKAAIEKASLWLSEKNIKVSETELDVLIESAVNALKDGADKAKVPETQTLQG